MALRVAVRVDLAFSGALTFQLVDGGDNGLNPIGLTVNSVNFGNILASDQYEDDHGAIARTASPLPLNQSITGNLVARDTDSFLIESTEIGRLSIELNSIDHANYILQGPDRCIAEMGDASTGINALQTGLLFPGTYLFQVRGGFATGSYTLSNTFVAATNAESFAFSNRETLQFGYNTQAGSTDTLDTGSIQINLGPNELASLGNSIFSLVAPEGVSFGTTSTFKGARIPITSAEVIGFPVLRRLDTDDNGSFDRLDIRPLCFETTIFPNVDVEPNFSGELLFQVVDGGAGGEPGLELSDIEQSRSLGRIQREPPTTQNLPIPITGNLAVFDMSTSLLHLPILTFDNRVYWADLSYLGEGNFKLAGFAPTVAFSPLYASFESASGLLLARNIAIFNNGELGSERYNLVMELKSDEFEFTLLSIESRF
ncbi:MAG: hypothetical protein AB8B95_00910 [Pseudohongiellaceae bacterium]